MLIAYAETRASPVPEDAEDDSDVSHLVVFREIGARLGQVRLIAHALGDQSVDQLATCSLRPRILALREHDHPAGTHEAAELPQGCFRIRDVRQDADTAQRVELLVGERQRERLQVDLDDAPGMKFPF